MEVPGPKPAADPFPPERYQHAGSCRNLSPWRPVSPLAGNFLNDQVFDADDLQRDKLAVRWPCGIEIEKHDQHVALLSQSPWRVVVDVDPDLQPGMPQPSADASRTPGPAKPSGKQLDDQRTRIGGEHLEATGRPQTASIKCDCGGTPQDRI
jgi:hypothetical protein